MRWSNADPMQTSVLYCGDNLDILRRYLPDAALDLVDLDPPFNSNRASSALTGTALAVQTLERHASAI